MKLFSKILGLSPTLQLDELPEHWPPLTITESPRSKHVNIKLSTQHGLEITLPKWFDKSEIPQVLHEKRDWIEKNLKQLPKQDPEVHTLPSEIIMPAFDKHWTIEQQHFETSTLRIIQIPNQQLMLSGNTTNVELCKKTFKRWLQNKGKQLLIPMLDTISQEIVLAFNNASIRGQKTRWGSCSSDKNINLNYKLVFFPKSLIRHVIIHELCHTTHLNHSKSFWKLVSQYDSDYKIHNKKLRTANNFIPPFFQD